MNTSIHASEDVPDQLLNGYLYSYSLHNLIA